jgi:membrane protease YdiL (CAAX protease family)
MSDLIDAATKPEVLDIQHDTDPAHDHGSARHIPHLGHALLFFSLATFFVTLCLTLFWSIAHIRTQEAAQAHPGIGLAAQAVAFVLTLLSAAWLFSHLWEMPFLQGISWNALAARRHWFWIVPGGVLLSFCTQAATRFLPHPPSSPVEKIMMTTAGAWSTALFGVLLAPLAEEAAFRGFLLPALATAYDWLSLDRTPAGLQRWESSTAHSRSALVFSAIFSSVPFALLHAEQLSHAWGIVGVLYVVSVVLSFARIKTHSVACSTLLHASYNLTIFVVLFVSTGGFRHLDQLK